MCYLEAAALLALLIPIADGIVWQQHHWHMVDFLVG